MSFADRCRAKACATTAERHQELVRKFNNLLTIRQLAMTSIKRPGHSFDPIPSSNATFFEFQLKIVLDHLILIFPNFMPQFLDMFRKYQAWKTASTVNLHALSKICDHLEDLVKISDNLARLNTRDFQRFLVFGPATIDTGLDGEKTN